MAKAIDVAAYILKHKGPMSAMKLQKLVYYCQAWSLVWDGEALFPDRIEAWANGPVVPTLYDWHRGKFKVSSSDLPPDADDDAFSQDQQDTIDAVLHYYGDRSPQWLSDLTHLEDPWKDARKGLAPGERSGRPITLESMAEYYESLPPR